MQNIATTVTFGKLQNASNPDLDGVKLMFPFRVSSPKGVTNHRMFISMGGSSLLVLGYQWVELTKYLFRHVVNVVQARLINDSLSEREDLPTIRINSQSEVDFDPASYPVPENAFFQVNLEELRRQRDLVER